MKEDRYEFDLRDWHCESWGLGTGITLTRKKPRVKVEWQSCGWSEWREPDGNYGEYHIVQFRVTGWDAADSYEYYDDLYIGLDARDKWSAPVLLPESVYSRLDEICRALEEKANVR